MRGVVVLNSNPIGLKGAWILDLRTLKVLLLWEIPRPKADSLRARAPALLSCQPKAANGPQLQGPELQAHDKDLRGAYRAERRGDLTGRGPGTEGSDLAMVPGLAPVSIAVDEDTVVTRSRR